MDNTLCVTELKSVRELICCYAVRRGRLFQHLFLYYNQRIEIPKQVRNDKNSSFRTDSWSVMSLLVKKGLFNNNYCF